MGEPYRLLGLMRRPTSFIGAKSIKVYTYVYMHVYIYIYICTDSVNNLLLHDKYMCVHVYIYIYIRV